MFGFLKAKKDRKEKTPTVSGQDDATLKKDDSINKFHDKSESRSELKADTTAAKGDDKNINSALSKTRQGFFSRIGQVFSLKKNLDEESLTEMEALLVSADVGIKTASDLINEAREEIKKGREVNEEIFKEIIKKKMTEILSQSGISGNSLKRRDDGPTVLLIVGVNGVGKTTTIGKLAKIIKDDGISILLCAADTFRAAAVEQLEMWGQRVGVSVVKGAVDAKPATVVYDAVKRAQESETDCLIIDTAGRLHNKVNLMSELEGIRNSIKRHMPSAPHEVWLVIDGATGQNALNQAKQFNEICPLTGIIVTKLDGTPKGGIIVAIQRELNIPIRYVGVGEGISDLKPFSASEFVDALFDEDRAMIASDLKLSANATIRRQRREN